VPEGVLMGLEDRYVASLILDQSNNAVDGKAHNSPNSYPSIFSGDRMTLDRKLSIPNEISALSGHASLCSAFKLAYNQASMTKKEDADTKAIEPPEPTPFQYDRPVAQLAVEDPSQKGRYFILNENDKSR
jgi:hypothetical protein